MFTKLKEKRNQFKDTVEELYQKGFSFSEWCFILKKEDKIIGRVGFWTPGENNAVIFGLVLPWMSNIIFKLGQKLLRESFKSIQSQGVEYIESQLDTSENEIFVLSKKLYQQVGLKKINVKKRFELNIDDYNYTDNNRLKYKSLNDVEQNFFIKIIKEVTKKTLDKEDRLKVKKDGKLKAAIKRFSSLKSLDYSTNSWFIAYYKSEIVGLVIPQVLSHNMGTINYIGVVPEKRGNGFVIDLLDKGIKNLIKRDINKIMADIDLENFPMEKALVKMDFNETKKLINYRKELC